MLSVLPQTTTTTQTQTEPTFVTMFFDLAKFENSPRRNPESYLKDAEFLGSLDVPLVIFTEPEFAEDCFTIRKEFWHKTKVYVMQIQDVPYFPFLEQIKEARQVHPMQNGSGIKDTASYAALVWSKMPLVCEVINKNPFGSTHFAWIDFGISYVAKQKHLGYTFSSLSDKIRLLLLRPLFPDDEVENLVGYYSIERGIAAAGYITGNKDAWKIFAFLFDNEVRMLLEKKIAPSEQQIFPALMTKYPLLFESYRGDYEAILSNYRKTYLSWQNIARHTMLLSRIKNKCDISTQVGLEIMNEIDSGLIDAIESIEKGDEGEIWGFVWFLQELFFALVHTRQYKEAEKIRNFFKRRDKLEEIAKTLPQDILFM